MPTPPHGGRKLCSLVPYRKTERGRSASWPPVLGSGPRTIHGRPASLAPGASIEDRPVPALHRRRSAAIRAADADEEIFLVENETHYAEAVIDNGSFGTRT